MRRVVYLSRAKRALCDADVAALLGVAHTNNEAFGLTGLLIYHKDRFFQVIEGPTDAVGACFRRISSDDRHTAIRVLTDSSIASRAFPQWKMAFVEPQILPTHLRAQLIETYDLLMSDSAERGDDARVRHQVRAFFARCEFLRQDSDLSRDFRFV